MRKYHAEITRTKTGFLARILSESGSQWGHAGTFATMAETEAAAARVIASLVAVDAKGEIK